VRPSGQQQLLIVITSPIGVQDPAESTPFDAMEPDELVFCCFFRELEQRAEFLGHIRAIAAERHPPGLDRQARASELVAEYRRQYAAGESGEALLTAIRWRASVQQRGYHIYSLKVGFAPYRTSCVVSFAELDADAIRQNLAHALRLMERERSRVLGFFGLEGRE
jgi:hypothetical protein